MHFESCTCLLRKTSPGHKNHVGKDVKVDMYYLKLNILSCGVQLVDVEIRLQIEWRVSGNTISQHSGKFQCLVATPFSCEYFLRSELIKAAPQSQWIYAGSPKMEKIYLLLEFYGRGPLKSKFSHSIGCVPFISLVGLVLQKRGLYSL